VRAVAAIVLAVAASSLFALSTALQALEARATPLESGLRFALLRRLAVRPRWLAGSAIGVAAWPLQAGAIALGSVELVQPSLGFGLVVLLGLAVWLLGEHVGAREAVGVAAIAAAVGVLGWAAPAGTGSFTTGGEAAVGAWVAAVLAAPYALRALGAGGGLATSVVAGLGWAAVGLATALVDDALADRRWLHALAWAIAVGAATWGAVLAEMTSLQRWPATRAVPVSFALEMAAPAAVAPALAATRGFPAGGVPFALALVAACAGAALLGGSRSVARAVRPSEPGP